VCRPMATESRCRASTGEEGEGIAQWESRPRLPGGAARTRRQHRGGLGAGGRWRLRRDGSRRISPKPPPARRVLADGDVRAGAGFCRGEAGRPAGRDPDSGRRGP
jgi:hypothetical protein